MRPDTEKILTNPIVIKKCKESNHPIEFGDSELLNTIKIPKNL